jgi:sugar/nucleoside kinase (ribokinase family)
MKLDSTYDVTAVGNAIVDVLAPAQDAFLTAHKLEKGMMTLVSRKQSDGLFNVMGSTTQQSGGSGANTIAGIAALGGKCAFIGKVADDEMGKVFTHDMKAMGVDFRTVPGNPDDNSTARCMILITPDAERTMATYLGISTEIAPDDLDPAKIRNAKITYLEGYLFDKEMAKEAFNAAAIMAHTAGKQVALTLSDPFCVTRHRADFLNLVNGHIDLLFANEQELLTLYETDDFNAAMSRVADSVEVCAITQGAKGATILFHGTKFEIPPVPPVKLVDTTGAGDLFAAGFLYGFTHGKDPFECGNLGAKAASEIIAQVGARPAQNFKQALAA